MRALPGWFWVSGCQIGEQEVDSKTTRSRTSSYVVEERFMVMGPVRTSTTRCRRRGLYTSYTVNPEAGAREGGQDELSV